MKDKKSFLKAGIIIGIIAILSTTGLLAVFQTNNYMKEIWFGEKSFNTIASASDTWTKTGWTYRMKITIDHTKVLGNLVNIPILFNYTSIEFVSHAQNDGDDFVFILNSTQTTLNHEIEYYDNTIGKLIAWVNVTRITNISDVVIYLYYGNSTCGSQQHIEETWNSNYIMVQHMKDGSSSSNMLDSTVNNNDGTKTGSGQPLQITNSGLGYSQYFDGSNDAVDCGTLSNLDISTNRYTIEAYCRVYASGSALYRSIVNKNDVEATGKKGYAFRLNGNDYFDNEFGSSTSLYEYTIGSALFTTVYSYGVITWDGTYQNNYLDGIFKGKSSSHAGVTLNSGTNNLYIGTKKTGDDSYFYGYIDEIRVSKNAQNSSWIYTTYQNIGSPSTFYSVGSQYPPDKIIPYPPSYFYVESVDSSSIQLTWSKSVNADKTVIFSGSYFLLSHDYMNATIIYNGTGNSYLHSGLDENTHYYYLGISWNNTGGGCFSNSSTSICHDTTMGKKIINIGMNLTNSTGYYTMEYAENYSGIYTLGNDYIENAYYTELPSNSTDGDWNTYSTIAYDLSYGTYYIQYVKPSLFYGGTWKIRESDGGYRNFSITNDMFNILSPFITFAIGVNPAPNYMDYNVVAGIGDWSTSYYLGNSPNYDANFFYEEGLNFNGSNTGYLINFTAESQLNISTNLMNAVETHSTIWNVGSGFWDIVFNATGNNTGGSSNSTNLTLFENIVNASGNHQSSYDPITGWKVWANYTGDTTPIHTSDTKKNVTGSLSYSLNGTGYWVASTHESIINLLQNIAHATGIHQKQWDGTKWNIWANYTGDAPTFHKYENIVHATGTHQSSWNPTTWVYDVWANYTGFPHHIIDNSINVTGTIENATNSTSYLIWINQSGNSTPLHLFENFTNCLGSHHYYVNATGYQVYANASGNFSSIIPTGLYSLPTYLFGGGSMVLTVGLLLVTRRRKRLNGT